MVGNVKIELLNVITDDDRLDEALQEGLVTIDLTSTEYSKVYSLIYQYSLN